MFTLYVLVLKVEKKRKTKGVKIFFCSIKTVFPMPGLFDPNGIVLSLFSGNYFPWFLAWEGLPIFFGKTRNPLFLMISLIISNTFFFFFSPVLTQLSFVTKNLNISRCENLLANRKSYLMFSSEPIKSGHVKTNFS